MVHMSMPPRPPTPLPPVGSGLDQPIRALPGSAAFDLPEQAPLSTASIPLAEYRKFGLNQERSESVALPDGSDGEGYLSCMVRVFFCGVHLTGCCEGVRQVDAKGCLGSGE